VPPALGHFGGHVKHHVRAAGRKNPQTIIQMAQVRCRRYSGTSADMYRTIFGLLVSLKLFLGRFDMRTMQARTSFAQHTALVGVTHSTDAVSLGISVTSINGGVGIRAQASTRRPYTCNLVDVVVYFSTNKQPHQRCGYTLSEFV